jgi:hypothetical protein
VNITNDDDSTHLNLGYRNYWGLSITIWLQILFIVIFTFVPGVIILFFHNSLWYYEFGVDIMNLTTFLSCLIIIPYPLVIWSAKINIEGYGSSVKKALVFAFIPIIIGFYYAFGMNHRTLERDVFIACGSIFTYFIIAYTVLAFNFAQLKKQWYLLLFPILAAIHLILLWAWLPVLLTPADNYLFPRYLSIAGTSEFVWGLLMIVMVLIWQYSISKVGACNET